MALSTSSSTLHEKQTSVGFNSCENCDVSLLDFFRICASNEQLFAFLKAHGVASDQMQCPKCKQIINVYLKNKIFHCQKRGPLPGSRCSHKSSQFINTFFEKSAMSHSLICQLVAHWLTYDPPRQNFVQRELGLAERTIVDWLAYCRGVTVHFAMRKNGEKIGGLGRTVEIYEAKCGKRKPTRGRHLEGEWIFAGVEREHPTRMFLVPVASKSKQCLLQVIRSQIEPGSTLMSDCWKTYKCLADKRFFNLSLNHSFIFVHSNSGAHAQTIERTWREVRAKVPKHGRKEAHFVGHLSEFMFKRAFPSHRERFHQFWKAVGELYTPTNHV